MQPSIFKKHLQVAPTYKGGKTLDEIQSKHQKIYKLSSNENPIGTSPKALAAIRQHSSDLHIYPDRTAHRLQQALAHYYHHRLSAEQFVATPSGSESIDLIIRAFLGEGLEYIVSNPCFSPYIMFATWTGATQIDVPLHHPDFRLDVAGILRAVTPNTRLLFLTSPNNPTGTYIRQAELQTLLDRLPPHVVVVLDEVYFHFADAADYTTALPFVQEGYPIIGVNSFSKTYGLAAMRAGYCYSTSEIASYIRQLYKPFLINKLALEAAIAALQDHDFVQQTVATVQQERPYLYENLDRLGLQYWKTQGNFILIKPDMDTTVFEEKMLEEGVMVRPVANFGAPGCVRVTIGTHEANQAYIHALEKVL